MSPILFEAGTTQFDTLGLGVLSDVTSALVTEELNGEFTLTMEYKVGGKLSTEIKQNRILVVSSSPTAQRQAFMIRKITKPIKGKFTVYAEHVSYLSYDMTLRPIQSVTGDAGQALTTWKGMLTSTTAFTVWSDITTTNQTSFGMPEFENARQALGGHAGSILDVWGGEYEFDNYAIRLHKQRGHAANTIVAYGRNLTDFTQEESILDTWTSIYPYVTLMNDGESNESTTYYLDELVVDGEHVNDYPNRRAKPVDFSQEFKDASEFTQDKLRSLANSYMHNNNFGVPSVSITLSALDLAKAAGYDTVNGGDPETINLADTVNVYFDKIGVRTSAQVTRVVWNVLKESYDSYDLGAKKASLADSIKDQVNTAVDNSNKALTDTIQTIVSSDGRHNTSFGDSSQGMPLNPKEGDIYFMEDGDDSYLYVAEVGEDGTVSWVLKTSTKSGEYINSAVDSAINEATSHADSLNAAQTSIANSISASAAAALASASTARSSIASQASSMANSAAAKGSSAANSAYTAAMSGATDAVNVLSSGVGVAITSTADSLNGKLTTAITSANVTASSYATVARNEAIATASQNTTTITGAAISSYGSKVASMYVTNTTFNQTVSGIQMAATQLETQVNAMGQVNQLFNTEFSPDMQGWNVASDSYLQVMIDTERYDGSGVMKFKSTQGNTTWRILAQQRISAAPGQSWSASTMLKLISTSNNQSLIGQAVLAAFDNSGTRLNGFRVINTQADVHDWKYFKTEDFVTPVGTAFIGIQFWSGNSVEFEISKIMLTNNEIIGDYTQGNYNNNARVSSLEVDVDGITGVVNNPSRGLSATWNLASNGQTLAVQASNAAAQAITTASAIQTKVSQLGAINRLLNTEFDPDLQGWVDFGTGFTTTIDRKLLQHGSNNINLYRSNDDNNLRYKTQTISAEAGVTFSFGVWAKINSMVSSNGLLYIHVRALDDSHSIISDLYKPSSIKATNGFEYFKVEGLVTPTGTKYLEIALGMRYAGNVSFNQPMLSFTNTLGDYVPGNYSNNDLLETYRTQLAGQITDEVANRTSGDNSVRTQLTDLVNQQVTSVTNGYKTAITQASDAIMASVSGVNLFTFSRFEDSGNNKWPGARLMKGTISKWAYFNSGNNAISVTSTANWDGFYHSNIPVTPGQAFSASVVINNNGRNDNAGRLDVWFVKTDGTRISQGGNVGIGTQAGWITAKIENMIVPDGAAYMQVSLINAMPTSSGSFFVMPMVNVGAKALNYTPDVAGQTALQLFSDSFALSLKDNIGNIISGINGDTSGLMLTGKHIFLDGEVTAVGKSWLDGAVIKDATIGRAQIAELSVDSSKIINLDVNKLSGNVANFIRTYWDGRYGSTSIDSEGMTVSAGLTTTVFDKDGMKLSKSGRSVGRIGVNDLYQDFSKKGLYFGLESTGDFMAWGAQNYAGNPYTTKLSWFRAGAVPSNLPGLIEGFNFEDNVAFINPVEMRGGIKLQGANDRLLVRASNLNGGSYPTFGGPSAYFVYAGSDIYLSSNGTAINLTKIAKAFGGIRTAAIPTGFNSNGTATGWYNVDMG